MQLVPGSVLKAISTSVIAGFIVVGGAASVNAQPPRQQPQVLGRARQACDAAAAKYGYRVMRRDRENVNGTSYQLPYHVAYSGSEADVTCQYDAQRGVATLPRWEDRQGLSNGVGRGDRGDRRDAMAQTALTACQNSINTRRGYQIVQTGTPVRHGANNWDVPVTVRRNGRRDATMTCRYNTANSKVSLR